MLNKLISIFKLFTPLQKREFIFLQGLVIIMSGFEIIAIASIVPFIALISDPSLATTNSYFLYFYQLTNINNYYDFSIFAGISVLILLLFSSIISIYTTWKLSLYAQITGVRIGSQLFEYYMHKPWLYHASVNSSTLIKQIFTEANRTTNGIIVPFIQINSKIVTAIFIAVILLAYNPIVTIIALSIFSSSYYLIFLVAKPRLKKNGERISKSSKERYRSALEGFGGIKDVLLLNRQKLYIDKFKAFGDIYAQSQGETMALAQIPRYFMEVVTFGSIIVFALYLLGDRPTGTNSIFTVLTVYALAGFKLLPALQQMYAGFAVVRTHISAFDSIEEDLKSSGKLCKLESAGTKNIIINNSIFLKNIEFSYPGKDKPVVIKKLNFKINVNEVVGIVGPSGSGKSTLIDILLGLVEPNTGNIFIDGRPLLPEDVRNYQRKIGFVPQSIYLSDASILENVAFGIPKKIINVSQVKHVLELSNLDKLIETLPDGLNTKVGERGVQLSGGQRQRIGIARALYHNAEILIFDEATSSLDSITEKLIMDAINGFFGVKTIIMVAHRLSTVKKCDMIYYMESGNIIDSGNYEDLMGSNMKFKEMAYLSNSGESKC
jgi:ATP-binding cassette, subfamily B, bacterial PglK